MVRLQWFGTYLLKLLYLCNLSWDLNVIYMYINESLFFSQQCSVNTNVIRRIS